MPETPKQDTQGKPAAAGDKPQVKAAGKETKTIGMGVRLSPVEYSDRPVVANYSAINLSPGIAFVDFGFFEPGMLAALPRVAQAGGKMPETLEGKLVVRVAMGFDALAGLHQQLGRVLAGLSAESAKKKEA